MNKRIAEMAEEAAEYALLNQSGEALLSEAEGCDEIRVSREFIEKFAELIVRECALQCVHNEDMDRIEKHFGVEE